MKILIVENHPASRDFFERFFERYGTTGLAENCLETLDAFLMAQNKGKPYHLIFLGAGLPVEDGIEIIKAVRDMEKQYNVPKEHQVKVILAAELADTKILKAAPPHEGGAYRTELVDMEKLKEIMEIMEVMEEKEKNTTEQSMKKKDLFYKVKAEKDQAHEGYFKSVEAQPDYQLKVIMETGTTIHFDFRPRLDTVRFGMLKDKELFQSVHTDGNYLIFRKTNRMPVRITASEFMDLVLIDRRK